MTESRTILKKNCESGHFSLGITTSQTFLSLILLRMSVKWQNAIILSALKMPRAIGFGFWSFCVLISNNILMNFSHEHFFYLMYTSGQVCFSIFFNADSSMYHNWSIRKWERGGRICWVLFEVTEAMGHYISFFL